MIRRLFNRLVKAVGVVLLAVLLVWFFPVMLSDWLKNPPEASAWQREKKQRRRKWKKWQAFCQWEQREKQNRFKRIEKKRKNFYRKGRK